MRVMARLKKIAQPCVGFSCYLTNHGQGETPETVCSQTFHCGANSMKLLQPLP